MSKRTATTPLNHDNWDNESEPEEAGLFTTASSEEMKNRVVKIAKRRNVALSSDGNGSKETTTTAAAATTVLFSGFTGFNFNKSNNKSDNPFANAFMNSSSNKTTTPAAITATALTLISESEPKSSMLTINGNDNNNKTSGTPTVTASNVKLATKSESSSAQSPASSNDFFYQRLKSLNEDVVKWITAHVNRNPHCVLSPIFRDYDRYFSELEKKYPNVVKQQSTSPTPESASVPKPSSTVKSSWLAPVTQVTTNIVSTVSQLGKKTVMKDLLAGSSTQNEEFETPSVTTGIPSTNSLMEVKPPNIEIETKKNFSFSFAKKGNEMAGTATAETNEDDENVMEEYVPPTNEVTPIVEKDAFYSIRCKLYYQHDKEYKCKGVGVLHLKKAGEKTQLFVRADTSLGLIFLNTILSSTVRVSRTGANNVLLYCIPDQRLDKEMEEKVPVAILIKVKSKEEADELHAKINENIK